MTTEPSTTTTSPKVFHFCETRCPHCEYVCSLPFGKHLLHAFGSVDRAYWISVVGHAQAHDTAHGSMEQTAWAIAMTTPFEKVRAGSSVLGTLACQCSALWYARSSGGMRTLPFVICRVLGITHTGRYSTLPSEWDLSRRR